MCITGIAKKTRATLQEARARAIRFTSQLYTISTVSHIGIQVTEHSVCDVQHKKRTNMAHQRLLYTFGDDAALSKLLSLLVLLELKPLFSSLISGAFSKSELSSDELASIVLIEVPRIICDAVLPFR